jgi:putative SOS response-associated peptidase YedK
MCYSAQIRADYKKFVRHNGASVNLQDFFHLYWLRDMGASIKTPRALDLAILDDPAADEIHPLIRTWDAARASKLEEEIFTQRTRVAKGQRSLAAKPTKKAADDIRIGTTKAEKARGDLEDLRRADAQPKDARIFPGHFAPVLVWEDGRRVVKPMRYQCRPAGKPAFYDAKYPGTYNARRENLGGFWKELFGYSHGLLVVDAFYENVARHAAEGRPLADGEKEENAVLEFRPNPPQEMLVACLWSKWTDPDGKEPDLFSFAAITDEPPPEIAAAGHDRVIIQIKPENVDRWLNPERSTQEALQAILEDRQRPYYQHRMVA